MPLIETTRTFDGHLDHKPLHIAYSTFRKEPPPAGQLDNDLMRPDLLTVTHDGTEASFEGDQIQTTDSPIGTLVSVQLFAVPDLGTTMLSFLLPTTGTMAGGDTVPLHTIAIKAHRRSPLTGPEPGQTSTYTCVKVHGKMTEHC